MLDFGSLRPSRITSFLGTCLVSLAASSTALAGTPGELQHDQDLDTDIFGGEMADVCAWPTVVSVGGCTATLIHPQVILYAAHCGGGNKTARFGNTSSGSFNVGSQYCRTYPEYSQVSDEHIDWAYCVLDYPVDIPIAPVVTGCEWDEIQYDDDVAIVGYGQTYNGGGGGGKRWAITKMIGKSLENNIAEIGGHNGPGSCPGDSGGPVFKRFADGSWRQFGIVSTGTADSCDEFTQHFYSLTYKAIPWVEEDSGIDVTPCTDAWGEWEPGPDCGGFFASEPGAAFGSWNNGCVGGPVTGESNTCGPGVSEPADDVAPIVNIVSPMQGDSFPNPSSITMQVDVQDDYGVKGVRLEIDGTDIGHLETEQPYEIQLNFGDNAVYSIQATAEDWSGNIGYSNIVEVAVGDVDPPDPTTTSTGTTDPTDSSGGEDSGTGGDTGSVDTGGDDGSGTVGTFTTGPGLDDESGDKGCACDADDSQGGGAAGLALFGLLALRRRRRSA